MPATPLAWNSEIELNPKIKASVPPYRLSLATRISLADS